MTILFLLMAGCGPGDDGPVSYYGNGDFTNPQAQGTIVLVQNLNNIAPQAQLEVYVAEQNRALREELREHWGTTAQLVIASGPVTTTPRLVIGRPEDLPAEARLFQGYHRDNIAYCNYPLSVQRGTWQVTCSHEVTELLTDAGIGRQICNPVAPFAYRGVLADFVFPSYYVVGSTGPWDYLGKVPAPLIPAPGGIPRQEGSSSVVKP